MKRWVVMIVPLLAAAALGACGGSDGSGDGADGGSNGSAGRQRLDIAASFYPLQFTVQRVAGDRADVTSLTPPGAEPHDLELTPKDVAAVSDADAVVYLKGFQASVDEAVANQAKDHAVDVAPAARLELAAVAEEGAEPEGVNGQDPHFWLDPTRLSAVAGLVADRLAALDPDGAATYRANATSVENDLASLDGEFRAGLADCSNKNLVTSHQAFGYLAQRYGLTQIGITGLTPDVEPKPADLARVTDFVRRNKVRTIYYETLVSPVIARTVASETGATTAVLDPIEGITKDSAGTDYLAIMRANLRSLEAGQPCP